MWVKEESARQGLSGPGGPEPRSKEDLKGMTQLGQTELQREALLSKQWSLLETLDNALGLQGEKSYDPIQSLIKKGRDNQRAPMIRVTYTRIFWLRSISPVMPHSPPTEISQLGFPARSLLTVTANVHGAYNSHSSNTSAFAASAQSLYCPRARYYKEIRNRGKYDTQRCTQRLLSCRSAEEKCCI